MPPPDAGTDLIAYDGRAVLYTWAVDADPYDALREELDWAQEEIRMFGKTHPVPRLVAYYGAHPYTYAGVAHPSRPMPAVLEPLREIAESKAEFSFNSVLGNYYRHGRDGMGYHRDNEPEIDPRCIASFSFGATRRFKLRHRTTREVVTVDLPGGSLLLMHDCQTHWDHALAKTRKPVGGRINLTFRQIREVTSDE